MKYSTTIISILVLSVFSAAIVRSQTESQLFIPRDIEQAYTQATRSPDGLPGKNYFQNQADYLIDALIVPDSGIIRGSEKIIFHNRSGKNLNYIVIKNYHDVFRKGAVRGRPINAVDAGLGIKLKELIVNSVKLNPNNPESYYARTTTNLIIPCKTRKRDSSVIEVKWETRVPAKTHERFGYVDSSSFFMAYWFPQLSVYDDINEWDVFDYNNLNEMYNEFGDFEVRINLPEDFLVWGSGVLQNPQEVLSPLISKRYNESLSSEKPVEIIGRKDYRKKTKLTGKECNTWIFKAEMTSDFAFAVSDHHLWSASMYSGSGNQKSHLHTVWLPDSENFALIPDYLPKMMDRMTEKFAYPFPYPNLTIFNGLDGMEFPMIVNDAEMEDAGGSYFLCTHEAAHTYFPFLVGVNQRRHGWLDEGLITMLGVEIHSQETDSYNFRNTYLEWYPLIAGTQQDIPPMVNSIFISDLIYQQHEYVRPAIALWTLKDILGEEMFRKCLSSFIDRWKYKHPTPYDFFFTFNDVSGENLNWFFQPWFLEFAYPDMTVSSVVKVNDSWNVEILNKGGMPFPLIAEVLDNNSQWHSYPLDARIWAKGKKIFNLKIPGNISPVKIVLNTDNYPDANVDNNTWIREF